MIDPAAVLRRVGPYSVSRQVAQGPFSSVFRARHDVLNTEHAVKVANPTMRDAIGVAMLLGAELQARVVHPNVVQVTDAGHHAGRPWYAMAWSPGTTLAEWIDRGRVRPSRVAAIFRGVVRGLCAIHRIGVVHRDLTPTNVLMVERGSRVAPRITDLGLAKVVQLGAPPRAEGLSCEYSTLGTPGYMAPEQFENAGHVDHRADLFSLGAILYELVSGQPAFDDEEEMMVFARVGRGDYTPLGDLDIDVSPRVVELVDALLQVDPDDRPESAEAVMVQLSPR